MLLDAQAEPCPRCGKAGMLCTSCGVVPPYSGGCPKDYLIEVEEFEREMLCEQCQENSSEDCWC